MENPVQISCKWKCRYCQGEGTDNLEAGSMSMDMIKEALRKLPDGWRWLDGKAWCGKCDPRQGAVR